MRVGFLGTGRMGTAMAQHVLDAGYDLVVWNRTASKTKTLADAGATVASTPAEAADGRDVVVFMLRGPDAVHEVLFGDDGVVAKAQAGLLVIDCTTNGPTAARALHHRCQAADVRYVDAPVIGSIGPAREGNLTSLLSGDDSDVEAALEFVRLWSAGDRIRSFDGVGTASGYKVVINLTLGVVMQGLGEAIRLGQDLELPLEEVLDIVAMGPLGGTVASKREFIESNDFQPAGFALELMAKDLQLALQESKHDLPATREALATALRGVAAGHVDDDYSALAGFLGYEGRPNSM